MLKRKEPLNIFKSLNKLKFIHGYKTIFQVLRVAHLGMKLGFQKVKNHEKCVIEVVHIFEVLTQPLL